MSAASQSEVECYIDLRSFKDQLEKKLPPDSHVLLDLLNEPDFMAPAKAEVLIPHYLARLERELEESGTSRPQLALRR